MPADFCAMARFTEGFADPAFVARLNAARFVHFTFGLESGSDPVLERMGKPFRADLAGRALERLSMAEILASVNLVAGFPGETEADVDATVDFIGRHADRIWSIPSVAVCAVPPSSALARDPGRYDITLDSRDPEAHETWTAPGNDRVVRLARRDRMLGAFARMIQAKPG
jgi:hypothetical protein